MNVETKERLVTASVTEKTVTIKLTSPVAVTVKQQVALIMIVVEDAAQRGEKSVSIRSHGPIHTMADIHPETIKVLTEAGMTVTPVYSEYRKHFTSSRSARMAEREELDVRVTW